MGFLIGFVIGFITAIALDVWQPQKGDKNE